MAKKILKNRTQITSTLENRNYEKLKELSEETMAPMSKLLDAAVEALFEQVDQKSGVKKYTL
ncbi:ribbon-helix-helix domain-containing protein [Bacillus infantis]|uniref:ribbon-helix-helix domain-containing protein n=1 Tax=Bacillus infantis TaxID=324767 RepID=UPI00101DB055|nr:ribbon-helix-helix domain-containing protein [Bacillus infantis]RYI30616.1 ribbon-helix-helix domain-containing protein [Bacillus infantis]